MSNTTFPPFRNGSISVTIRYLERREYTATKIIIKTNINTSVITHIRNLRFCATAPLKSLYLKIVVRLGGGTVELVCRPIEKFVGEKSPNSVKAKIVSYCISMMLATETQSLLIPSQCLKTVCREYTGTTLNGKDWFQTTNNTVIEPKAQAYVIPKSSWRADRRPKAA